MNNKTRDSMNDNYLQLKNNILAKNHFIAEILIEYIPDLDDPK